MDKRERIVEILSLNGVYFGVCYSIADQLLELFDDKKEIVDD